MLTEDMMKVGRETLLSVHCGGWSGGYEQKAERS